MKKILILHLLLLHLAAFAQQKIYEVIAYYTGNGETIKQYPVKDLTHIIYSFLKLQNDTLTIAKDEHQRTVEQLKALKKTSYFKNNSFCRRLWRLWSLF